MTTTGSTRSADFKEDEMANVTSEKCACADCVCKVSAETAVKKDGRNYCSDACANGHAAGAGCDHAGCACHG
jgi:metallothionein